MVVRKLHKVHQRIALQDEGEFVSSRAPVRHTGRDAKIHFKGYLSIRSRNILNQWCEFICQVWQWIYFTSLFIWIRLNDLELTHCHQSFNCEFGILNSEWLFEPSSREQYNVKRIQRISILIRSPELFWANSRLTSDNVAHSGKQKQNRMGRREQKHSHCFSENQHVLVVKCFIWYIWSSSDVKTNKTAQLRYGERVQHCDWRWNLW